MFTVINLGFFCSSSCIVWFYSRFKSIDHREFQPIFCFCFGFSGEGFCDGCVGFSGECFGFSGEGLCDGCGGGLDGEEERCRDTERRIADFWGERVEKAELRYCWVPCYLEIS